MQSQTLPTDSATERPVAGGVSARLVDDSKNGVAEGLMTAAPTAPLVDVGLFIDANSHALNKAGIAEQIQVCFPSCGGGCAAHHHGRHIVLGYTHRGA